MKLKILIILPTLNYCGGIESFFINYYKNMSTDITMDVITHENDSNEYKEFFEERGGNIYVFEKLNFKNMVRFIQNLKAFFRKHHDYDVVHCNMANAAFFYFYYAKKYEINTRILHSHQSNYADKTLHKIRNIPLIFLGKKLATNNVACSKIAGDFLFGKKEYVIFNNAVDTDKFVYNKEIRKNIRKKYEINDCKLIGNIGRLTKQKNHRFLIDIFKEIKQIDENYKLLIIGNR